MRVSARDRVRVVCRSQLVIFHLFQVQLDNRVSSALASCVERTKIDGAKIAGCHGDSDNFGKLLDQQFRVKCEKEFLDGKMPDSIANCFLALTSYLSAAVLQVSSLASLVCMAVCGLLVTCAQGFTVDSGNTCMQQCIN